MPNVDIKVVREIAKENEKCNLWHFSSQAQLMIDYVSDNGRANHIIAPISLWVQSENKLVLIGIPSRGGSTSVRFNTARIKMIYPATNDIMSSWVKLMESFDGVNFSKKAAAVFTAAYTYGKDNIPLSRQPFMIDYLDGLPAIGNISELLSAIRGSYNLADGGSFIASDIKNGYMAALSILSIFDNPAVLNTLPYATSYGIIIAAASLVVDDVGAFLKPDHLALDQVDVLLNKVRSIMAEKYTSEAINADDFMLNYKQRTAADEQ